jgi:hypothetical protein
MWGPGLVAVLEVCRIVICEVRRCFHPPCACILPPLANTRSARCTHTTQCVRVFSDGVGFHDGRTHLGKERDTVWAEVAGHGGHSYYQKRSSGSRPKNSRATGSPRGRDAACLPPSARRSSSGCVLGRAHGRTCWFRPMSVHCPAGAIQRMKA